MATPSATNSSGASAIPRSRSACAAWSTSAPTADCSASGGPNQARAEPRYSARGDSAAAVAPQPASSSQPAAHTGRRHEASGPGGPPAGGSATSTVQQPTSSVIPTMNRYSSTGTRVAVSTTLSGGYHHTARRIIQPSHGVVYTAAPTASPSTTAAAGRTRPAAGSPAAPIRAISSVATTATPGARPNTRNCLYVICSAPLPGVARPVWDGQRAPTHAVRPYVLPGDDAAAAGEAALRPQPVRVRPVRRRHRRQRRPGHPGHHVPALDRARAGRPRDRPLRRPDLLGAVVHDAHLGPRAAAVRGVPRLDADGSDGHRVPDVRRTGALHVRLRRGDRPADDGDPGAPRRGGLPAGAGARRGVPAHQLPAGRRRGPPPRPDLPAAGGPRRLRGHPGGPGGRPGHRRRADRKSVV